MGQLYEYSDLEQEIITGAGNAMAREIDREVLWGMLQGMGWTRVLLPNYTGNEQAVEIMCWLEDNCKGSHKRYGRDVIFEDARDANWFILRWGTV